MVWQIILGSSLVAALVTIFSEWGVQWWRIKQIRYQKFYGPLKLHLWMLEAINLNRTQMNQHISKKRNDWIAGKEKDSVDNIYMNTNKKMMEINNPLTTEWWFHTDNIKGLIENNTQYIKKSDEDLIKEFIDFYFKRGIVGRDLSSDTAVYISEENIDDYISGLIKTIEKMINRFTK